MTPRQQRFKHRENFLAVFASFKVAFLVVEVEAPLNSTEELRRFDVSHAAAANVLLA
jgi:hypothetical protein